MGTAPSVTTSPTNQTVNAGDTATFTAAASGTPAPTVQWEVSADNGTTFTPISGATSTTYSFAATAADSGNQYEAVFSNGVGTPATSAAATLTVVYVAADQADLGPNNDTAAGFTINNGAIGETYSYTAQSSGGSATVTGSGTLTSSSQDVTPIDVSALLRGTLTYTVTLGSGGTPLTATATLKIAPSGYAVTADQSSYNAHYRQIGRLYRHQCHGRHDLDLSYRRALSADTVYDHVPVTSSTQDVTGIDITSFNDGQITFIITLTDTAGNVGDEIFAYSTLNTTAPAAFTIAATPAAITPATQTDTGFTFAGATTGTTYSYTVTSSGGTGSVSGSGTVTAAGQTVSGIDVSTLPDGTLTYSVTLTNSFGNTTTATATAGAQDGAVGDRAFHERRSGHGDGGNPGGPLADRRRGTDGQRHLHLLARHG